MDLNTLWFILIAVLYIGFFVLEGFDFGVGILLPFLSRGIKPMIVPSMKSQISNIRGDFIDKGH